jgi:hypothetical protein
MYLFVNPALKTPDYQRAAYSCLLCIHSRLIVRLRRRGWVGYLTARKRRICGLAWKVLLHIAPKRENATIEKAKEEGEGEVGVRKEQYREV